MGSDLRILRKNIKMIMQQENQLFFWIFNRLSSNKKSLIDFEISWSIWLVINEYLL